MDFLSYISLHVFSYFRVCEEGLHNMPDVEAEFIVNEILKLVMAADDRDLIVELVSRGRSALLPLPSKGISLREKRKMGCYE